jgi:predicted alpha/beta-fold hydrolase
MSTASPPTPLDGAHAPEDDALRYRAPYWLPNSHVQTIVPALFARRPTVAYRR